MPGSIKTTPVQSNLCDTYLLSISIFFLLMVFIFFLYLVAEIEILNEMFLDMHGKFTAEIIQGKLDGTAFMPMD